MNIALVIVSVLIGDARVLGVTHPAYQAVAHLFVGGLIVGACIQGNADRRRACCELAVALSILEVLCATVSVLR